MPQHPAQADYRANQTDCGGRFYRLSMHARKISTNVRSGARQRFAVKNPVTKSFYARMSNYSRGSGERGNAAGSATGCGTFHFGIDSVPLSMILASR